MGKKKREHVAFDQMLKQKKSIPFSIINRGSVHFWNNVIDEYTSGNYRLVECYQNEEVNYEDGTPADVFFFEN